MQTFKDWHDLYLAIDVDGLADKFEHFRNMSMGAFGLDPAHYVSNPGLFKDAMLKHTREKLELHSDIDMYNLIEANIRGGMSIVTERHCVANNKYMGESFDATQPCPCDAQALQTSGWEDDGRTMCGYTLDRRGPAG